MKVSFPDLTTLKVASGTFELNIVTAAPSAPEAPATPVAPVPGGTR